IEPFDTNMNLLDKLQSGDISTVDALGKLSDTNKVNVKEIMNRLLRVYQTGLLEFHITDACDLDCTECHYRTKGNATIPFSYIGPILARLQPKAITITGGGEPNVYKSEDKNFNDVVLEIRRTLPNAMLGLINNNTKIVTGDWTKHINWQRTSVDTSNPKTYFEIKRRDKYEQVLANVKSLLADSTIPYVGIGFLYRPENVNEISDFLRLWHDWFKTQPLSIQQRFNIQFRPIAAQIDDVSQVRAGNKQFVSKNVQEEFSKQILSVIADTKNNDEFERFIRLNTNFGSMVGKDLNGLHQGKPFANCFNAFAHRVFRSTGEEYPDFLLPNFPKLSMGNTLLNGDEDLYKVALLQFWYFNKRSPFCSAESCRQAWVNNMVEGHIAGDISRDPSLTDSFY
ncbi:MAG: hypothetical protein WCH76_01170, partial [Candidatus Riflemargulisbacteria bacterium]